MASTQPSFFRQTVTHWALSEVQAPTLSDSTLTCPHNTRVPSPGIATLSAQPFHIRPDTWTYFLPAAKQSLPMPSIWASSRTQLVQVPSAHLVTRRFLPESWQRETIQVGFFS